MELIKKALNSVVKEIDVAKRTLTAVISTNTVDRMGDIVEIQGVDLKNFNKNPVVAWAHNYSIPTIGRALWIRKKDKKELVAKVEFASTPLADEVFGLYKEGFMRAFSIGFLPIESEPINPDDSSMFSPKRFKKIDLLEFSAVPVPANPEALTLAIRKGVVKTDSLIDQIQKEIDEEGEMRSKESKEQKSEEKEEKQETKKEHDEAFSELIAENEVLKETVSELEKEIVDLKYKLYVALQTAKQKSLEMTGGDFEQKAFEIASGVIRAHIGKV